MTDDDREFVGDLARLRRSIDNLDAAMVHLLAERFRCTDAIGELKARHGLESRDPRREAAQLKRLRFLAAQSGLDPDFTRKLHALVVREVVINHEAVKFGSGAG
ncbi:chorismate mutase [Bradyrhizobium sp. Arg816]|uniref:chorismate mutase n=1 Tax=Bradyrhizobium sp. Arg816 TaxID=2998491 RepID=UPI00249F54BE|nr:chorismate mutase [Bradyrhizobium sp. Arg816]MDI3560852.1 chorismate mutase [Bradyrhizobium sp. Arg816]